MRSDGTVGLVVYFRFLPCLAALVVIAAPAQNTVDFSGTWRMDATRSESAHQAVPSGPVTMVISQSPAEIGIETRRGRSSETLIYKLDGSENAKANGAGTPVSTKAHWEGAKLVTETERNVQNSTVTTRYVLDQSADGAEMTIDKTLTIQHGYQFQGANNIGRGKDVFVRVKARAKRAL